MSQADDLQIPISQLIAGPDGVYTLSGELAGALGQARGLLEAAIVHLVSAQIAPGQIALVSSTHDVAEPLDSDSAIQFSPRIDRRTRTLVFASGVALQAGQPILQATCVFRIV